MCISCLTYTKTKIIWIRETVNFYWDVTWPFKSNDLKVMRICYFSPLDLQVLCRNLEKLRNITCNILKITFAKILRDLSKTNKNNILVQITEDSWRFIKVQLFSPGRISLMEWKVNPDWNKPLQLELTSDWLTAKFSLRICWVKAFGSKGKFHIRWRVFSCLIPHTLSLLLFKTNKLKDIHL